MRSLREHSLVISTVPGIQHMLQAPQALGVLSAAFEADDESEGFEIAAECLLSGN